MPKPRRQNLAHPKEALQEVKSLEKVLQLPPAHSIQQERLIYAWELRYDPRTDPHCKEPFYEPARADWEALPVAYPDLRIVVGACGTKFGKTYGCCIRLAKEGWENDNINELVWWVAPSERQAENAWQQIIQMLPPGTYEEQIGKNRIAILDAFGAHRSYIEFKTGSDPSKLRGFAVRFFVMDEAAQGMPEASFTSIETTTTNTKGRGIIISTPNGRGWFYDVYQRGEKFWPVDGKPKYANPQDDPYFDFMSVCLPTHINPYNDPAMIERKRKSMSAANFRQEYLAKFLVESAGVFENITACTKGVLITEPLQGRSYVIGADLADRDDYTVLTVMDRVTRKVVYWERFHKKGWPKTKQVIRDLTIKWNHATVVLDTTGVGAPIFDDLVQMGVHIFPYLISTNNAKVQLIDTLVIAMENASISFPYIGELDDELRRFEKRVTPSGNTIFGAPKGRHDDCVISLALAVQLLGSAPPVYHYRNRRGV